jgi:hypothetical protein
MAKNKKQLHPPHPTPKGKNWAHHEPHVEPSHWVHEISISKNVGHHFWPGLMVGAEFW